MKNPEGNFLGYLYGEILSDKVHIIGCVACRSSHPPVKKGFPAIPDWKNEDSELSSLIPKGKLSIQSVNIFQHFLWKLTL